MTVTEDAGACAEDAPQQPREEDHGTRESCESRDATLPVSTAVQAMPSIATRALSNRGNPVLFATMLDLRAVCRLSLVSRATRNTYGRRAKKACLTEGGGVPDDCRVEFWKCALNVQKVGASCVVCVFFCRRPVFARALLYRRRYIRKARVFCTYVLYSGVLPRCMYRNLRQKQPVFYPCLIWC